MKELPESYFCPKCGTKADQDFIAALKKELPSYYVVRMALEILFDAHCPTNLLKQLGEWSSKYNRPETNDLNPEEVDKMALIKWREWANK